VDEAIDKNETTDNEADMVLDLLIDEENAPLITEDEAYRLKPIQKKFMESYVSRKNSDPVKEWLTKELKEELPDKTDGEISEMSSEIIATLETAEKEKSSLESAVKSGRSKESWFASRMKEATSQMGAQEASKYYQGLDDALISVNERLRETITTQSGNVNQVGTLDGYIAEQHHAQTFNLNAQARGSEYRAEVLGRPENGVYGKNSVDIVIKDGVGKTVRRYQSKYCKDTEATSKAFAEGDYRGQRKLVPSDQGAEIKNASTKIEAPDGTASNPLSKGDAKDLQREAQGGKWNDKNWNEYAAKDLAVGVAKQTGQAALMGAAIGVGFNIAEKVWKGEDIDGEEIVETALKTGADFGVKAAAAGALKVGAERGIISCIPKGTPAGIIANVVFVAVENVKIVGKMIDGELTPEEGLEKMEETTVSTVAGIAAGAKGAAVGAAIGSVFGPPGAAVGALVGGTVGYMAGSKIGETVVKVAQKVRKCARVVVPTVIEKAGELVDGLISGVSSLFSW
jgi:hypothetical protein